MNFSEYSNYDGLGLAELVKKKQVKPVELVEAAIERIERHNPQINAVVFKAYDDARARAKTKLSGVFAGVPMLLKDILGNKQGWPTRSGSASYPPYPRLSMLRWCHASKLRASSRSVRPTCRNLAPRQSLSRNSMGPRAILGI